VKAGDDGLTAVGEHEERFDRVGRVGGGPTGRRRADKAGGT
jgi:hypothetical protein